jgi:hypothetical protein
MFTKENIVSMAHTFIATFITIFCTAVIAIPQDKLFSLSTWSTSFFIGILISTVRAVVKSISQKYIVQSL